MARSRSIILCSYSNSTVGGELINITKKFLPSLKPNSFQAIKVMRAESSHFHVITSNDIHYFCYSETPQGEIDRRVVLCFINKLKDIVLSKYSCEQVLAVQSIPLERELQDLIIGFNQTDPADIIKKSPEVLKKLNILQQQLAENLDEVTNRGKDVDKLLAQTEELKDVAIMYLIDATKLKNKFMGMGDAIGKRKRNIICGIILFVAVCLVAYIIAGCICGFTFKKCGKQNAIY